MPFHEELQGRTVRERAELLAAPAIADCLAGRVTRTRYVGFLRQAYHHVRHTVPLLEACAQRFGAERAALRKAIAHYIAEETGHEQWILDDLRACGDDPDDARRAPPALATELMVAYVYDYKSQTPAPDVEKGDSALFAALRSLASMADRMSLSAFRRRARSCRLCSRSLRL